MYKAAFVFNCFLNQVFQKCTVLSSWLVVRKKIPEKAWRWEEGRGPSDGGSCWCDSRNCDSCGCCGDGRSGCWPSFPWGCGGDGGRCCLLFLTRRDPSSCGWSCGPRSWRNSWRRSYRGRPRLFTSQWRLTRGRCRDKKIFQRRQRKDVSRIWGQGSSGASPRGRRCSPVGFGLVWGCRFRLEVTAVCSGGRTVGARGGGCTLFGCDDQLWCEKPKIKFFLSYVFHITNYD